MTSNDPSAPAPGNRPNRRRALGRGPGAAPPTTPPDEPAATPEDGAAARLPPPVEPAVRPEQEAPAPAPGTPDGEPGGRRAAHPSAPAPDDPDVRPARGTAVGPAPRAAVQAEPDGAPASGPETRLIGTGTADAPAAPDPGPPPPGAESEGGASGAGADGGEEGDGRFTVRLANFEGPFDLLLQLIAKHKLDVTEVALSKVTDEFMAYIRALGPDWDLDETTEFLVVAATLLDLKAARLLPAAEVEDEADLALLEARDLLFARLLQYRAYKRIAEIFSGRLDAEARRHPRTVGLEPHHAELLPEVVISIGPEGFARLAVKAMQPRPKPQVYVDHIHAPLVSVQEQAGIVVARLRELGEADFRTLVEDTDDTLTVVARFLALLELYREKAVALEQDTALGELTVRWTGGDGDAVPAVTDEFDRPPEQPEEERKT
ncbi:Segregation and condensation protein A [Streptomyces sp. enrichment culture]|uniref:segregation and condensation protein A n=1 Tax=Streptomyces sp. enrichment culture TaxID=1795815 RepID=UPI003F578E2E